MGESWQVGDRVHITGGAFAGMDGEVLAVFPADGYADVRIVLFGRAVPVCVEFAFLHRASPA